MELLDFVQQELGRPVLLLNLDRHHLRLRHVCLALHHLPLGVAVSHLHGSSVVVLVQLGVAAPLLDGVLHARQARQLGIDQTPVIGVVQGKFVQFRDLPLSHPPVGRLA